jgi:DtxR family Mn-dependent transcriptional regulator
VKPSSVTAMLKHLADDPQGPYVRHTPYRGVELTDKGAAVALKMLRLHRLIELFLAELLELPWDEVHVEAERLEHALSENLEARIAAKLGHPTHDPHGDPIPGPDGWMPPLHGVALCTLPVGAGATVVRVPDGDPALLQYLSSLGLVPGASLRVHAVAPYGDVITLRVADAEQVVGAAVARRVLVCPDTILPAACQDTGAEDVSR